MTRNNIVSALLSVALMLPLYSFLYHLTPVDDFDISQEEYTAITTTFPEAISNDDTFLSNEVTCIERTKHHASSMEAKHILGIISKITCEGKIEKIHYDGLIFFDYRYQITLANGETKFLKQKFKDGVKPLEEGDSCIVTIERLYAPKNKNNHIHETIVAIEKYT